MKIKLRRLLKTVDNIVPSRRFQSCKPHLSRQTRTNYTLYLWKSNGVWLLIGYYYQMKNSSHRNHESQIVCRLVSYLFWAWQKYEYERGTISWGAEGGRPRNPCEFWLHIHVNGFLSLAKDKWWRDVDWGKYLSAIMNHTYRRRRMKNLFVFWAYFSYPMVACIQLEEGWAFTWEARTDENVADTSSSGVKHLNKHPEARSDNPPFFKRWAGEKDKTEEKKNNKSFW